MTSQGRYIRIISGVGAGALVAGESQLCASLPPVASFRLESSSSSTVPARCRLTSAPSRRIPARCGLLQVHQEKRQSPSRISFARWVSIAIAPMVVGDSLPKTIADFAGFSAGVLTIMVGAA